MNTNLDLGFEKIAYGNGRFVTYGRALWDGVSPLSFAYSDDGINWTRINGPKSIKGGEFPFIAGIVFANGVFVTATTDTIAAWSTDGINWTQVDTGLPDYSIHSIVYGEPPAAP
jgi:hypothetical protein